MIQSLAGSSSISSSCGLKDCFLCGRRQCDKTCALCGLWFCSRAHQLLHQDQEGKCYPFQIRTKSGIGRYLVATRNIEPGEIVFREEPIIIGNNHETQPVCLGCLQPVKYLKFFLTTIPNYFELEAYHLFQK